MAIKYKDYYQALDVPRTATQDEIKQAYRKLARKYHPDVSGGQPGSEDRFKEINEAYEVLKNPEKRRAYDSMGQGMENETEFRPPRGWEEGGARWRTSGGMPEGHGFNFQGTGFSDFFEAFFGSGAAGGSFGEGFGDPFAERGMGARGFRQAGPRRGEDLEADIMVTLEEAIRGSTRQVSVRRQDEIGRPGRVETYQVKIPPGVRQGQSIRLAGKGEPGTGGGTAGNLYLRVRLSEHPDFRVEGSDILHDLSLAPWEAVLGARVSVPTPSGTVTLKVPPGTVSGQKIRLRHQGLPKKGGERGDMFAVVQVQVPRSVSPEEKELWEKLARVSNFRPRR